MDSIKDNIDSYIKSIDMVYTRIAELHKEINENGGQSAPRNKTCVERRYRLYTQLWEMQSAKKSLEEYLKETEAKDDDYRVYLLAQ